MRKLVSVLLALSAVAACRDFETPTNAEDGGPLEPSGTVDVVVVLNPAFAPGPHEANRSRAAEIAAEIGGAAPRHAYGAALFGFAGSFSRERLDALRHDPRVLSVELDVIHAIDAQDLPTGINRVEADRNPNADVDGTDDVRVARDVAVLDTGIDPGHPDLHVAGGINFNDGPKNRWRDQHGHGTHVAGTIGALDNGFGVVGIAPGARLWAVRVCNNGGLCSTSARVAGMDWIAARKADFKVGKPSGIDFVAANMSIGFPADAQPCGPSTAALHQAACAMIGEGVFLSMSAGNEAQLKAAWPEPAVVSALADFDGQAGSAASPTCRADYDDSLADFSNYGPTIDIAAPGVCILSTYPGGYAVFSGTSMASPHVAGAAALYLHANGLPSPRSAADVAAVKSAILSAALPQGHACGYTNERAGQGSLEPLLFVNDVAFGGDGSCTSASGPPLPPPGGQPPTIVVTAPQDGSVVAGIVVITASASDNVGVAQVEFFVDGASLGVDTSPVDGWSRAWDTSSVADGSQHTLTARAMDNDGLTGDDSVVVTVDNTSGSVHIGDLDGTVISLGSQWRADVTVTVHDAAHNPINYAIVRGTWNTGQQSECQTWSVGRCAVGSSPVKNSVSSFTFTVDSVTYASFTYDAAANHDPDGSSNGTTVTVTK